MTKEAFVNQMQHYMPARACEIAYDWLEQHPVKLRIAKPRKSKLGDYRIRGNQNQPTISINGNLNPYAFSVTLAHEIAHHFDFVDRKTLDQPHGSQWKKIYSRLLTQLLAAEIFPNELSPTIAQHIQRPKAASCSDPSLLRELRMYDEHPTLTLEEIPDGAHFIIKSNGRQFIKGIKKRTRYLCVETRTDKKFMVHGQCEVEINQS